MFKNKKGFTFIELSVVILIISILFAGTSVIFAKLRDITYKNETINELKIIKNALKTYFLENEVLPCPSGLKLMKTDANFGVSKADCTTEDTTAGVYISGNLVYGAVPFKDLNIYPDFTYDSWGNKFSYIINNAFIDISTFAKTSGENSIIINQLDSDISDNSGATDEIIKNDVIVLVISHGSNGNSSFKDNLQDQTSLDSSTNI